MNTHSEQQTSNKSYRNLLTRLPSPKSLTTQYFIVLIPELMHKAIQS